MNQTKIQLDNKARKTRTAKLLVAVLGGGLTVFATVRATNAREADPTTQPTVNVNALVSEGNGADGKLKLTVNKSAVVTTRVPYKRVSVGQPEIADVNPIGPGNILVTAKKAGTTQLIIWDDMDRSQVIDVTVEFDLQALQDQYKQMFPNSTIEVGTLNGAIALRGRVPNLETAEQAAAMAAPYTGKVLNFLEVSGGRQVMLKVRFAEVSRSASNALGVSFAGTDGTTYFGSHVGQINPFPILDGGVGMGGIGTPQPSPAITLFGNGQFGSVSFAYFVQALRTNNLLRVLAEPNLIAISGQEASFLAGGEFPVPVTQGGGTGAGGTAVTVEYREFGVKLRMIPVVLGDGRIRLKVAPEVSDLDFTTAVQFNGFVIPGLITRKVETVIELNDNQTFAIAGLLNNNVTATKNVTPVLGDLPVIGALFRSVRYQRKETELVVLVTPVLVEAMNPAQVPELPGEKWRDPNDVELYLGADLGGPLADTKNAPEAPSSQPAVRFQGPYGYTPAEQTAGSGTNE